MNVTKFFVLGGLLLAAPLASADLSYSNATIGYVFDGDIDGTSVDVDGFVFSGRYAVNENIFLLGNYQQLETDPGNLDIDRFDIGVGYHSPVTEQIDVVGTFSYSDVEVANIDGDGFEFTAGLRGMPNSMLEFGAYLVYEDIDSDNAGSDSDTGFALEGRYLLGNNISAGLNYRDVSDLQTFSINARFDF